MRRCVQFLLLGGLLVLPAIAQRGGSGFSGRGVVRPGARTDGLGRFPRQGFFPGNDLVGYGIPMPDDSVAWDAPDNICTNPDSGCGPTGVNINYGYVPPPPAPPVKITEYHGPSLICPQTNGKPLYRIAIPAGRNRYQDNIWVAHDYSYTNGILTFKTQAGEEKQTPVSSVNKAITIQLNRECGLNFQFPK